ncbi:MAG: hypothetical protein M0C28_20915 [Candidatus Moduliflexus flocculans]|nr:hypothetical protein [Candidatus Moduliflexus flocculans]
MSDMIAQDHRRVGLPPGRNGRVPDHDEDHGPAGSAWRRGPVPEGPQGLRLALRRPARPPRLSGLRFRQGDGRRDVDPGRLPHGPGRDAHRPAAAQGPRRPLLQGLREERAGPGHGRSSC